MDICLVSFVVMYSRLYVYFKEFKLIVGYCVTFIMGFILGYFTRYENNIASSLMETDFIVIGNIIPGLIANWMDRQGVLRTIFTILITAGVTKLFIMTLSVYQLINIQ